MKTDFVVARLVILVLEVIGWLTVVVGVVLAVWAFSGRDGSAISALSMLGVAIVGLLQVAAAQITKAVVVTAESTTELVVLARRSSVQSNAQPQTTSATRPSRSTTPLATGPAREVGRRVKVYKGKEILLQAIGVSVDGQFFGNVFQAESTSMG